MVACCVRDDEVVGSNPATPTYEKGSDRLVGAFFVLGRYKRQNRSPGAIRSQVIPVPIARRIRPRSRVECAIRTFHMERSTTKP